MAEIIQYIGLTDLDPVDQDLVKKLSDEYYPKIRRLLNNMTSLAVHIKTHSKGGKQSRYEITIRAIAPTKMFEVGKTEDYELPKTLHKAYKDIITEIEHHFKD